MHPLRCLPASLVLFALASSAMARDVIKNPLSAVKARAVDKAIETAIADQKLIGVSVGILQQGRIVYLKGYGAANREGNVPVSAETVFNWASNSKPVAAVLAMQLVEKKKLDLDACAYRSSITDFARGAESLLNRRLVSQQIEAAMWTIQPTKDGKPTTWGLGFTVENGSQGFKVSHNGSQPEVATRMVLYPKAKRGVVAMTNSGYADVGKISTAVYSALNAK